MNSKKKISFLSYLGKEITNITSYGEPKSWSSMIPDDKLSICSKEMLERKPKAN